MVAPSLIAAARRDPDARVRISEMASLLKEHRYGADDGCTEYHLRCAGFTDAEISVYRGPAVAMLSGKPSNLRTTPDGRAKGVMLRRKALSIRERMRGQTGESRHA